MSLFNRLRRKMAREPKATKKEEQPEQQRSVKQGKGKENKSSAAIKHLTLVEASSLDNSPREPGTIIICGGGIVGLALALALKKQLGVTAEVYEQADAFVDDVGAGMGMYPNGLRVLRDISPALLQAVRDVGLPYLYRRLEVR
jgi:hypothetical protein